MSHHVFVETLSYLAKALSWYMASNKGVLIHFANLVLVSFKCSCCLFTHRSVLNVQNDFVTILCSSSITSALCCVHFHRALASGFRNGNRHWMVPGGRWIERLCWTVPDGVLWLTRVSPEHIGCELRRKTKSIEQRGLTR